MNLSKSGAVFVVLAGLLLMVASSRAVAGAYPLPKHPHVNDFTGRLTPGEIERTAVLLAEARNATGIEGKVVVIDSIRDYATGDRDVESFATNLFNAWGIGDAGRNDGVLFLVALEDRAVRIELGAGYADRYSGAIQEVLDRHVLPRFRAGDVGGGVYEGVRAAMEALAGWRPAAERARAAERAPALERAHALEQARVPETSPTVEEAPTVAAPERQETGFLTTLSRIVPRFGAGGIVGLSLVALIGGTIALLSSWRHRRRRCPNCGLEMSRCDEVSDDEFLSSEQQSEESVGSVNYDVWRCEGCNYTALTAWRRWFSPYSPCPSCGARTLATRTLRMIEPTYSSTGEEQITRTCQHCGFGDERIVVLPMLVQSDSSSSSSAEGWSSSSSFGGSSSDGGSRSSGGSSSGGGATGRW